MSVAYLAAERAKRSVPPKAAPASPHKTLMELIRQHADTVLRLEAVRDMRNALGAELAALESLKAELERQGKDIQQRGRAQ